MQHAHSVDGQTLQEHLLKAEEAALPRFASMLSESLLIMLELESGGGL
jgi:hypothetical protein